MAVVKMMSAEIVGTVDKMSYVLSKIGDTGVFHPDDVSKFYSDTASFTYTKGDNPYAPAIGALERICPECIKGGGTTDGMTDGQALVYIKELEKKFDSLLSDRERLSASVREKKEKAGHIKYFFGAGVNLSDLASCEYTHVKFGSMEKEAAERLTEICGEDENMVFIPTIVEDETQYGICCSHVEYADEADRILSGLYFKPITPVKEEGVAEDIYRELCEGISAGEELIRVLDSKLAELRADSVEQCRSLYVYLKSRNESFALRSYVAVHKDKFIICGWIPENKKKEFSDAVCSVENTECKTEKVSKDGSVMPPTKLKNNPLIRPYEFYVGMYGLPSYGELDPTPFVGITYTILFGIMFGDVGQGIMLSLIGYLMWKLKKMALGKILVPCGICSALFGLVYGSVFGFEHLLDPMYKAMGFSEKPVEVMKPAVTQIIIYGAVALGVVLVLLSMIMNIVSRLKKKEPIEALCSANGLSGLVMYTALVAGLVCQLLLNIPLMNAAYIVCLIVIPLILIFSKEHIEHCVKKKKFEMPESVADYIMQNFFELFEAALGYVTNTMSFLRVGAFVLVHAGMMTVVFTLAEMTSGAAYVLIVVLGNGLVMCLEGLLVGIQVLRLEFYEMFSRFFDGGGRAYEPVGNSKQ